MSGDTGTLMLVGAEAVPSDRLLTAAEVAAILGVRAKRVYELGIPFVQLSARSKRWSLSDVETWIAARRRTA